MNYSPEHLIAKLRRIYVAYTKEELTIEEFRDIRDCIEIAYENGAWRNNPEVLYKSLDDPRRVYKAGQETTRRDS